MVERRFPRDFSSLEQIYAFVRQFLGEHGIDEAHAWDVDLIVEELFTNMVKYGGSDAQQIALALDWKSPTLTLRLCDSSAVDFDPTLAPPPDTNRPITDRHAGGLGIHLVRQIADDVAYVHDNGMSTITVTKRLAS